MKKTIKLFLFLSLFFQFTIGYSQVAGFSSNQLLVKLPSSSLNSPAIMDALLLDANAIPVWTDDDLGIQLWEVISFPYVTSGGVTISNINESVTNTRDKTEVDGADLNYIGQTPDFVTTQNYCSQLDFSIFLPQGDQAVKVSILDTGISNINDNSNNSFNFEIESYSGYDYVDEDPLPNDLNGHGTHLAGIMAAMANFSSENKITFDIRKTHDEQGSGYLSATVRAIKDAIDAGSNIINMSFSYPDSGLPQGTILQNMIEYAEAKNVLVIASAGNNSVNNDYFEYSSFPASFPDDIIISVAASNCTDNLASFSNYGGTTVDLAILGVGVLGPDLENGIVARSGTSQSAALISGLSAILATHQSLFNPSDIKCSLLAGSRPTPTLNGVIASGGVVDGTFALNNLSTGSCSNPFEDGGDKSFVSEEIKLYPNPVNDVLNLVINKKIDNSFIVRIIDTNGRIVNSKYFKTGGSIQMEVGHLTPGVYLVSVLSGSNQIVKSIIKM